MKLESVGTVTNEKPGDSDHYYDIFSSQFEELIDKSDVIIATAYGETYTLADQNFRGGRCQCCSGISIRDIEKAEGFKIVPDQVRS